MEKGYRREGAGDLCTSVSAWAQLGGSGFVGRLEGRIGGWNRACGAYVHTWGRLTLLLL